MISKKDIVNQFKSGRSIMDTMCDFIIRPPRCPYTIDSLGPKVFRFGYGRERYRREDIVLENMRGMSIRCSWYRPVVEEGGTLERRPCVVYCHANCGSRYDGMEALFLLKQGLTLFTFDFCGSGMSDGEYISLGFYERQDLAAVVEYLNSKPSEVDGIALWGRSMGAVTSIMYASKDPSVRCVVCDSPFASLRWVIQGLVSQNGGRTAQYIPKVIIRSIVERIRKRIAKRAAFDMDDLDTMKYASECVVPGLLFHGQDDDFVLPAQSMAVRDAFVSSCLHMLVKGGHNDERDREIQDLIVAFIRLYTIEKPQASREQGASAADGPAALGNVSALTNRKSGLTSYEVRTGTQRSAMCAMSSSPPTSRPTGSPITTTAQSTATGDAVCKPSLDTGLEEEREDTTTASQISAEPVLTDDDTSVAEEYLGHMDRELSAMARPRPIAFAKVPLSSADTDGASSHSQ